METKVEKVTFTSENYSKVPVGKLVEVREFIEKLLDVNQYESDLDYPMALQGVVDMFLARADKSVQTADRMYQYFDIESKVVNFFRNLPHPIESLGLEYRVMGMKKYSRCVGLKMAFWNKNQTDGNPVIVAAVKVSASL